MIYKDSEEDFIIKKRQLLSKNIGKKKYLYNCKFQFKTKYSLNEIFIFIKILYFFILILFSNIYKIKIFNNEKEIYYSHTKYKIYNKIFKKKCLKKINFGIYNPTLSNGGRERITALLITYLFKVNIFNIYLFTRTRKNKYEYQVPENTIRIQTFGSRDLINKLIKSKIDVFVYQSYNAYEMELLNKLTNVKTIFYNHSSFWFWIYFNRVNFIPELYRVYKNAKYVISLIPFENDFLFKKWGINSILMNNFVTYQYDDITPSDLTTKNIIMIGRANDRMKRFDLGLKAMKYIVEKVPESQMLIISNFYGCRYLINLVNSLKLENNVKFVGYSLKPEMYFQNSSLHIFPTIIECFPMVLSETKIYGIPNIITGIDYVSAAKGGVINVNNDDPKAIANESIKILKDFDYRKKLGKMARESMKKFKNEITAKKWIELILAVYNGEYYYNKLKEEDQKITEKEALNYLQNHLNIIKVRNKKMNNVTLEDIINFNFVSKYLKK